MLFTPFTPERRRTEAVVEVEGHRLHVTKGALRAVAEACGLESATLAELEAEATESAKRGFRTLAVAVGGEHGPLRLAALVMLHDPPRPDAGPLIAELRHLGVSVKMLTGDGDR